MISNSWVSLYVSLLNLAIYFSFSIVSVNLNSKKNSLSETSLLTSFAVAVEIITGVAETTANAATTTVPAAAAVVAAAEADAPAVAAPADAPAPLADEAPLVLALLAVDDELETEDEEDDSLASVAFLINSSLFCTVFRPFLPVVPPFSSSLISLTTEAFDSTVEALVKENSFL